MPAFPRSEDADDTPEAEAWANAFSTAEPQEPFTSEEKAIIRDLMVQARLAGQDAALARLTDLSKNPDEFRQFMAEFHAENPPEESGPRSH